jgi:hypothetical protein
VTLRAVPGDPQRTEVTVTCDLRPGVRRNVRVSQALAGRVGGGTGFFTGAVLAKGAAVALSTAVLGPGRAVGLATVGVSLAAIAGLSRRHEEGASRDPRRPRGGRRGGAVEDVFGTLPAPADDSASVTTTTERRHSSRASDPRAVPRRTRGAARTGLPPFAHVPQPAFAAKHPAKREAEAAACARSPRARRPG